MKDEHDPGTRDLEEAIADAASRPRAICADVFAGGFSLGVMQHFDVACHLEETNYGVATARKNFPNLPIYVGPENWPIAELKKHEWDFLACNPPCAAWSVNGKNVGERTENWRTDPRVACTRRCFGLLKDLRPRVWAWESVPQALTKGRELVDELTAEAVDMGYSVTYLIHDAQWLGVPQKRKRFFFVAHRPAVAWPTPNWAPARTPLEALEGIAPRGGPAHDMNGKWSADQLALLRPGERLYKLFERVNPEETWVRGSRGQVIGRPSFGQVRLPADRVGPATVGYAMVHPTEHRWLTVNEVQALAGFPDDFEFVPEGSGKVKNGDGDRLDLIARGVCPGVGEWLARAVAGSLGGADAEPVVSTVDISEPPEDGASDRPAVRRERTPRAPAPQAAPETETPRAATLDVRPKAGLGSGAYIRLLLSMGRHDTKQILELVHRHYPASKAGPSDVAWNRGKMRKEGAPLPAAARPDAAEASAADPVEHERQPQAERAGVDPDREFDKTSLRANSHGRWLHRDYLAHTFRWSFAGRFIGGDTEVLDVGCGPDVPMIDVLTMPRNQVPKRYVGVDLNREPRRVPSRAWAAVHWEFNFLERHQELGKFDVVTCFEMIEHVRKPDGARLLTSLAACLKNTGTLLLSTPVFNGRAAANHLHEYQIDELQEMIERAGLRVENRFGTFASQNDIKKVATPAELDLVQRLSVFHSGEVMACFLSPLYPDASRNNIWCLKL